jgi:hypothetical protein
MLPGGAALRKSEPVVKNDMQIVPHYLLGIEMSAMPKGRDMGDDAVHLEVDADRTSARAPAPHDVTADIRYR